MKDIKNKDLELLKKELKNASKLPENRDLLKDNECPDKLVFDPKKIIDHSLKPEYLDKDLLNKSSNPKPK